MAVSHALGVVVKKKKRVADIIVFYYMLFSLSENAEPCVLKKKKERVGV